MSTATIVFNRLPQARARIERSVRARLIEAANALRDEMIAMLDNGSLPIQTDTAALGESLFVQAAGGGIEASDYAGRLNAARNAYTNNESRWRELIRDFIDSEAYSEEHFNARVAQEEPLPSMGGNPRAGVATMLAYGAWWEFGHQNLFTERYEHAPWMLPVAERFYVERMTSFFGALLKD